MPKFFHDAVIFYHSRLFLFLDGHEQGKFEALDRDLRGLTIRDASLALVGQCVSDVHGELVHWAPGFQVFPISPMLTAYFNSTAYAETVRAACAEGEHTCDPRALGETRAMFERTSAVGEPIP